MTGFTEKIGPLAHVYAMLAVVLGWTVFRSSDLTHATSYLGMMFGAGSGGLFDSTAWYYLWNGRTIWAATLVLSLPVVPYVQKRFAETAVTRVG